MLGTPANNSTAVPNERRNQTGQISVRNKAIPKLTGNAIRSAISEVDKVPAIAIKAPYLSLTGSHSIVVRKEGPNSRKAGQAPKIKEIIIPTKTNNTQS